MKESTRELTKLCSFLALIYVLLVVILGFAANRFYMPQTMPIPALTQILIALSNAFRLRIFYIIPRIIFVIILLFLLEALLFKNRTTINSIYKKINIFLIAINALIAIGIILPFIK